MPKSLKIASNCRTANVLTKKNSPSVIVSVSSGYARLSTNRRLSSTPRPAKLEKRARTSPIRPDRTPAIDQPPQMRRNRSF